MKFDTTQYSSVPILFQPSGFINEKVSNEANLVFVVSVRHTNISYPRENQLQA